MSPVGSPFLASNFIGDSCVFAPLQIWTRSCHVGRLPTTKGCGERKIQCGWLLMATRPCGPFACGKRKSNLKKALQTFMFGSGRARRRLLQYGRRAVATAKRYGPPCKSFSAGTEGGVNYQYVGLRSSRRAHATCSPRTARRILLPARAGTGRRSRALPACPDCRVGGVPPRGAAGTR